MLRFTLVRVASVVPVLFALSVLVFVVSHFGGGDPVHAYLGANASQEAIEATRARLGLDEPLVVQYWSYVSGILTGDLGQSLATRRPVAAELSTRVPATLELAAVTIAVSVLIGVGLARAYALQGRGAGVLRFVLFSAASAPAFLVATAGVVLLAAQAGVMPVSGRTSYGASEGLSGIYVLDGLLTGNLAYSLDALEHLALPALAGSLGPGVALARVLADGLSTNLSSKHAQTARSLGETESQVLRRHGLRNAASPALSLLGVQVGMMLSSLVVVEEIFSWNGLGQYLVRAINTADTTTVATLSLLLGAVYVVLNTVVDLGLAALDPRTRLT